MELKSPEKESEWKAVVGEDGSVKLKKKSNVKRGAKSRAAGGQFEARVRSDLEEKGWIVDKWTNNVDLDNGKIVPAKRKFNPFAKVMTIGTGFPDFICFQNLEGGRSKIVGVEVKMNGNLSKIEKEKMKWYADNKIFSELKVAKKNKVKNRVSIEYIEVEDILKRMRK